MTALLLLAVLTFTAGHIIRDGWPSFKEMTSGVLGTHAARLSGALVSALGILPFGWLLAALVFLGVAIGFYTDSKHAAGQGGNHPLYLAISGLTSLAPLALLLSLHLGDWRVALIVIAGLIKPPIWIVAWKYLRPYGDTWFCPTRMAAGAFGGLFGLATALALGMAP